MIHYVCGLLKKNRNSSPSILTNFKYGFVILISNQKIGQCKFSALTAFFRFTWNKYLERYLGISKNLMITFPFSC